MSILSLLFGFISFLLLALDSVNLIQIVVLVSIYISGIYVVSLFLVVGINLCIAKLLLFPNSGNRAVTLDAAFESGLAWYAALIRYS